MSFNMTYGLCVAKEIETNDKVTFFFFSPTAWGVCRCQDDAYYYTGA